MIQPLLNRLEKVFLNTTHYHRYCQQLSASNNSHLRCQKMEYLTLYSMKHQHLVLVFLKYTVCKGTVILLTFMSVGIPMGKQTALVHLDNSPTNITISHPYFPGFDLPGPMPTLIISAPERISSSTISPVTTLPAQTEGTISHTREISRLLQ